ncbi:uncharacterized protein TRAVEDRAFT_54824 [Trametes versicolor FP-101664 SS1]|uniref:Uncharacterized protein n=1 Tax=Trametes versicolor (strain FP-101664) TaxID=717944 RepID=R7S889_TRAVS|nr:uncharacterized protein TRAVEDRAFT_54824 [Trametes versicolor FP-101664 SS1]EIW51169.1 hypothetical protein TRAVEDRAFT_54824 [Trametes versicolor FP-101664 SS1]
MSTCSPLRVTVRRRVLSLRELAHTSASASRRAQTRSVREEPDLRRFVRSYRTHPDKTSSSRPHPTPSHRAEAHAHARPSPIRHPLGAAPLRAVERRGRRSSGSRPWGHRLKMAAVRIDAASDGFANSAVRSLHRGACALRV